MSSPLYCAAVDLGATTTRLIVGEWTGSRLTLIEVTRFPNAFRTLGKHDYWEVGTLWHGIQAGLGKVAAALPARARITSVGVDTWGVDQVLLTDTGRLVLPVHAYRDTRTCAGAARLAAKPAALKRIYATTGIANHFYNTSHQLAETVASFPGITKQAARCLFLSDYFNYLLSGRMENELTISSTSQLLSLHAPEWSREMLDYFHVPPRWFSQPIIAGTKLGRMKNFVGAAPPEVIAVPGHDTACAYDAMPAASDGTDLFISSGTWSIVGCESDKPVLGPAALAATVSNERTSSGRYRPLMNVMGLWLLEQTVKSFSSGSSQGCDWLALTEAASRLRPPAMLFEVDDPAFSNPPSMREAIDCQLKAKGARPPTTLAGYARLIIESLGEGHAQAMRALQRLSCRKFRRVIMVGGGSKNPLLCQATARATNLPVISLGLEGSIVGNLASQLVALGAVPDLTTFRHHLAAQVTPTVYSPPN